MTATSGDHRGDGAALVVLPVRGLPEIRAGHDLAALIASRAQLRDGDVLVVSQKVVSKAEGAVTRPQAGETAAEARRRLAREAAARVVADTPAVLIVETAHGFVCANAGIDASNVPGDALTLLPADPDASARRLREGLAGLAGVDVGVVVADTFGRPWRQGQTDVAIGVAGLCPIRDDRGLPDRQGTPLEVTEVAVADEVAAAADLVRGKADGVPAAVVRGLRWVPDGRASVRALVRPREEDLFLRGRGALAGALGDRPGRGPVDAGDLERAIGAAVRNGGASVDVRVLPGPPTTVAVRAPPGALLEAGAAAATLAAALVDAGYAAAWRPARVGEDAVAVVEAGPAG